MTTNTGIPAGSDAFTPQQIGILLSTLAYSKTAVADIKTYLPHWSIVWNGTETEEGNYAFIAVDQQTTTYVLAIRGSLPISQIFYSWDAFANWVMEDLDVITRVPWTHTTLPGNALIANGTNTAFTQVQGMQDQLGSGLSIYNYLKTHAVNAKGKQVIITGHSLGGNIANVYASYFVTALEKEGNNFSNSTSLITFAAPAAGNEDFATDLDKKIPNAWHYENSNDIIPKFPVGASVSGLGWLYNPGPSAAAIDLGVVDNLPITLQYTFWGLAAIFAVYGYERQRHNYEIFTAKLDPAYEQNTITDFFYQVAQQHHPENYATNLGVVLPLDLVEASKLI